MKASPATARTSTQPIAASSTPRFVCMRLVTTFQSRIAA